jgi:nicotinamide phosphoribosyltransferase
MCLEGVEGEVEMMRRVLEKYPNGIVACVSDTYDIMNAVNNYW